MIAVLISCLVSTDFTHIWFDIATHIDKCYDFAVHVIFPQILPSNINTCIHFIFVAVELLTLPMETIESGILVGNINGTIIGSPTLVTGKKGLALQIGDYNRRVDFGDQSGTCLGNFMLCIHGWVAAFWMRPDVVDNGYIMDTGGAATARQGVLLEWRFSSLIANFFGKNKYWILDGGYLGLGWSHVVTTWGPCCGPKLYINGGLVASDTIPIVRSIPVRDTYTPRLLLCAMGAITTIDRSFKGTLDEFRVWDMVMRDEEVRELYNSDL